MSDRMLSRRGFVELSATAGAGLLLGLRLPGRLAAAPDAGDPFVPNVWVRLATDGAVTITVVKAEMGQGVWTALPMLVAEELDADWGRVSVEPAAAFRPEHGDINTGGSSSVSDSWDRLRRAGAVARELLVQAAAERLGVDRAALETERGAVVHPESGRRIGYGELAAHAARLPVPDPATVRLKEPAEFRLIGTRVPRLDTPAKVDGSLGFGLDVRVPGMLFASIERCPVFGGKLAKVDDRAARRVPGVVTVVQVPALGPPSHVAAGVAVVATSTWAALQGRRALAVTWDEGPHAGLDAAAIAQALSRALAGEAIEVRAEGGARQGLAGPEMRKLEAEYEVPYLAHATMEPMNGTAAVTENGCEVWAPTQYPGLVRRAVAGALGLPPEAVRVHVTFLGGGFGRRINPDFAVEAALVARAAGKPVQVVWNRGDDLQHDFYRPASRQRLRAALDAGGGIAAWWHRLAGPSTALYYGSPRERAAEQEKWGAEKLPYAAASFLLDYVPVDLPVPLGWWRSVANSQNVFCIEAFVDELAAAAGQDPLAWRLRQATSPRLRKVLEVVRDASGWGRPLPRGRGRGVAACAYDRTFVAQVVEVRVEDGGAVAVERVVCAFDCGQVVHPDSVEAQIEGSIAWALSAALWGEVPIERGRAALTSFLDYPILRLPDMPPVEIHLVASREPPAGVGEPAVPPLAPALVNALFAATGRRVRRLPLRPAPPDRTCTC